MSMLRSAIPWTVHSPPTLSPQLVGMKGCHKPSTYSSIGQVNIQHDKAEVGPKETST